MRIIGLLLGVVLGALLLPDASVAGEGPRSFEDRPQVGQPVRFTDAAGHVFRPERLVILTREGTRTARIPATASRARSEEHLDLSGLPLVGHVFRDRLAPGDAERLGIRVGPLMRVGSTLVLDAREAPATLQTREIVDRRAKMTP